MDFFSSIFLSVASFFGFGSGAEMESAMTEPVVEERVEVESTSPTGVSSIEEDGEVSDEPETSDTDSSSETDMQSESGEVGIGMTGEIPASPEQSAITNYAPRTMIVAGGCFWCVEADLEKTNGVIDVVSGYSGGDADNPTYRNYGSGGHREVVEVTYDPSVISFEEILIVTMKTTDPTDDDGTFGDRGDKYSSAFYYENDEQKQIIENLIEEVNEFGPYNEPLAIDVEPRAAFWKAEDEHQDYYKGTFTKIKYRYYREASGRNDFIERYWGVNDQSPDLPWRDEMNSDNQTLYMWSDYQKPSEDELKSWMDPVAFKVTQKDGTERAGTSPLDKVYEDGVYVDVLSGEPLFSSKDKFDSGTGWPSFTKPITPDAVTERDDRKLFVTRTEIRSAIADNHIGHVFNDGPRDSTGLRYCMNGVALKFIPKDRMEEQGYGDFLQYI